MLGADAFGAVARPDHRLARRRLGAVDLFALEIVEPRAQHLPRLGAILVLATLVLLDPADPPRAIRGPHRDVGHVAVLAGRPAPAVNVDHGVAAVALAVTFPAFGYPRHT